MITINCPGYLVSIIKKLLGIREDFILVVKEKKTNNTISLDELEEDDEVTQLKIHPVVDPV